MTSDRLATMMPNELGPQLLHSGLSIGICKVGKWQFANNKNKFLSDLVPISSNLHFATSITHFGSLVRSGTWCEATHLTIFSTAEQIEVEEQSTARPTSFAGLIAFSITVLSMLSI